MRSETGPFSGWLVFLCALLLAGLVLWAQAPPRPLAADAPADRFSAGRAMPFLRSIARAPHPLGSVEHARVRERIVRELSTLGVAPQVQEVAFPAGSQRREGVVVRNVLARLPGTGRRGAVLLACHYDTWPASPGAADDGAAVAALLETLRAVRQAPPLARDLILLFTDAEESGLLGAQAFVEQHPWARDVEVLLSFDARGVRGPLLMYESSTGNSGLLAGFAAAGNATRTSSLFEPLYQLLPQRTDFTVFRHAGLRGLSFAFIGGEGYYHTKDDTVENLDERTLQDLGEHALALARHFGDRGVPPGRDEVVFFDLFGAVLVRYPIAWARPLAALAGLALLAALILGFARKTLTVRGVASGAVAFAAGWILVVLANSAFAWVLLAVLRQEPGSERILEPLPYLLLLLGLTLGLSALSLRSLLRRIAPCDLAAGAWLSWAILLVAAAVRLPAGSYLFSWPLLFAAAGLAWRAASRNSPPVMKAVAALTAAVPGVVLWIPMIAVGWMALGLPAAGVAVGAVSLLASLLLPGLGGGQVRSARRSGVEP